MGTVSGTVDPSEGSGRCARSRLTVRYYGGAEGGTRTPTPLRALDPESSPGRPRSAPIGVNRTSKSGFRVAPAEAGIPVEARPARLDPVRLPVRPSLGQHGEADHLAQGRAPY
jgi:hypothetical protein